MYKGVSLLTTWAGNAEVDSRKIPDRDPAREKMSSSEARRWPINSDDQGFRGSGQWGNVRRERVRRGSPFPHKSPPGDGLLLKLMQTPLTYGGHPRPLKS